MKTETTMLKHHLICSLLSLTLALSAFPQLKVQDQTSGEIHMTVDPSGKVNIMGQLRVGGESPAGTAPSQGRILFSNDAQGNLYWSDPPATNDYLQWNGNKWITTAPAFQPVRNLRMEHFEGGSIAECTNGGEMYDAAVCSGTEGIDYGFSFKTHNFVSVIELAVAGSNYGTAQTTACNFYINYWTGSGWSGNIDAHSRSLRSPNNGITDQAFQHRYDLTTAVPDGHLVRYAIQRTSGSGTCAILMAGWTNNGFRLPINSMGHPNPWVRN
jgi:hypothetical protein